MSLDITPYLKTPTIANGTHFSPDELKSEHEREMKIILDQNNFLEERNRILRFFFDKT